MKPHYKAVIVVIASEDEDVKNTRYILPRLQEQWRPLYPFLKEVWEQYCNCEPLLKTVFVYGGGIKQFIPRRHDWIYEDVYENNHPGMITKTLRAFADIEALYKYDYIIRTNLSTFWDFPKLISRLNTLPDNCICGTPIKMSDREGNQLNYTAGYDLVISRSVVQKILPHSAEIIKQRVYCDMEDLSLCTAVSKYASDAVRLDAQQHHAFQMLISPFEVQSYKERLQVYNDRGFDHVRAKNRLDRNVDKQVLQHLLYDVYGKTILSSNHARASI